MFGHLMGSKRDEDRPPTAPTVAHWPANSGARRSGTLFENSCNFSSISVTAASTGGMAFFYNLCLETITVDSRIVEIERNVCWPLRQRDP